LSFLSVIKKEKDSFPGKNSRAPSSLLTYFIYKIKKANQMLFKRPILVAAGFSPRRTAEVIAFDCNALKTLKTRKLTFAATFMIARLLQKPQQLNLS
jgi:hypothetical protein